MPLVAVALSIPAIQAVHGQSSYQWIGGNFAILAPSGQPSSAPFNWNTNLPWDGIPGGSPRSVAGSNLNIASTTGTTLFNLTAGGSDSLTVNSLSITTSAPLQTFRTNNVANAVGQFNVSNGLMIADDADLEMQTTGTALLQVSSGSLSVGSGSTLGLSTTQFSVTGSSNISGSVLLRVDSSNNSLGDTMINAAGTLILGAQRGTSTTGPSSGTAAVRSLSGSGSVYASDKSGVGDRFYTLAIGTAESSNASFSGTLNDSSVVTTGTNRLSVSVSGDGTQTLTGVNTYTGSTSITGGTLAVSESGSINGTSGVTINGGELSYNSSTNYTGGAVTWTEGTLGGTNWEGNLGGLTVGANQVIAPGNSVGTASTTSQTWTGGGTYEFELQDATGLAGTTGWDLLNLSGELTLTATPVSQFTIQLLSLNGMGNPGDALNFSDLTSYTWLIADAGSAIAGFDAGAFDVNTIGFSNDATGVFSIALGDTVGGDNSQLYLVYTAVPEPSTTIAVLLGLLALVVVGRRRAIGRP